MNEEIEKYIALLRDLIREQIERNAELHVTLERSTADLNKARMERDAAWYELIALKARMKEEA